MKIITTSGGCQGNFWQGLGLAARSFPSVRGPKSEPLEDPGHWPERARAEKPPPIPYARRAI